MGYRGEDVPDTHGDWGRQTPWQPSPGAAPGSTGAWDGGSQEYADDENYPPYDGGGFGYGPDGGYSGQGPQGYGPQDSPQGYGPQDSQYGDPYEQQPYGQHNGYGQGQGGAAGYDGTQGYPQHDDYGYDRGQHPSPGYGQAGYEHNQAPGYAPGGGYQDQSGGYGQAPAYPARSPGGGYTAPRGGNGGYPALPSGQADYSAEDAGNDWYGAQAAAANGASFADTGSYRLNGRVSDEYGSGPHGTLRDPVRGYPPGPGQQGTGPQAFAPTGSQAIADTRQQERYEDPAGYPDYGQDGPGGRPRPGASGGFQAPGGRDGFDPRGGYAPPDDYATAVYNPYDGPASQPAAPAGDGYNDYGDDFDYYDADGDPYQDRYGTGPHADGAGRGPGTGSGGRAALGPLRGKRLLFAALAVVAVGVLGTAAYVFVLKPSSPASNSKAPRALPSSGAQPSQQACVKQLGTYCHIETATGDPTPLTTGELFPPAFTNEKDKTSYSLVSTKVDKTCGDAVIGTALIKALKTGKCTQALRASYVSGDNKIMGTIGVLNLSSTNQAHYAGKVVGQNDFIAPLTSKKGVASKLGNGTGVVEAEFKGHYLILTWSEFVDGTDPKTKAQATQLEQFSNDLVSGTANIDLSQRMVTGSAPTPAAS